MLNGIGDGISLRANSDAKIMNEPKRKSKKKTLVRKKNEEIVGKTLSSGYEISYRILAGVGYRYVRWFVIPLVRSECSQKYGNPKRKSVGRF